MHTPVNSIVFDAGGGDSSRAINEAVRRFRAGIEREASFAFLVERYARTVHQFFRQRGATAEDAHDLTQETFLAIYRGLDGFRGDARFGTWVFAIAYNTWRRRQRLLDRGAELPLADHRPAGESKDREWVDHRPRADETLLDAEARRRLHEAVDNLSPTLRHCLALRIYRELSYRQIAEILGVSLPVVKARLFQARQQLHQQLGSDVGDLP